MELAPFSWDEAVFTRVSAIATDRLDYFCGWPTYFGDPVVLVFIATAAILTWDDGKTMKKIFTVALATGAGYYASHGFKAVIHRPRPYTHYRELIEAGGYKINSLFGLLLNESSFPSSHAATVFAMASVLTALYGKRMLPAYLFAVFISFTRVYVGAHFPSDIIGGAVVGITAGWLIARLMGSGAKVLK